MKILNLYAGIGGNRKLWGDLEVTSVELDPAIAEAYKHYWPNDEVIVGDAHNYLIENYHRFDFIWSSPPCPTHGQYRYRVGVLGKGYKPVYPDMKLYEEIIFLQYHAIGKFVVENTKSYYEPLVAPQVVGRHYFWANFSIPDYDIPASGIRSRNKISDVEDLTGFKISHFKNIKNKRQVLRNCVNSDLAKHVIDCAIAEMESERE